MLDELKEEAKDVLRMATKICTTTEPPLAENHAILADTLWRLSGLCSKIVMYLEEKEG